MSVRRRLRAIERDLRLDRDVTLTVIWPCGREDDWRPPVESHRAHGGEIRVIRIGIESFASSVADAQECIARRVARGCDRPIVVRSVHDRNEVLARWDPGLPDWLAV